MKKMIKSLLGIVMITLVLSSCNTGSTESEENTENTDNIESITTVKNDLMDDLIAHFKSNEFDGEMSEKDFELIGAIGGVAYENEDFSIELYKFNEAKDISEALSHRNGQFGMMIHRPKDDDEKSQKLIDVFSSFE